MSKIKNRITLSFLVIVILGGYAFPQNNCPKSVSYEGKVYNTVLIGRQCWLKENLNIGTMIEFDEDQKNNGEIEKYCYDDLEENCIKYGGLYQWDEAMRYSKKEGSRGLCPQGWHIPTKAEFETLKRFVNKNGNALKEIGQGNNNGAGTNESGFSGLLAGYRYSDARYVGMSYEAHFWTSNQNGIKSADYFFLQPEKSRIDFYTHFKIGGMSIRCVKD